MYGAHVNFKGISYPRYGGINKMAISSINKTEVAGICTGAASIDACSSNLLVNFNNRNAAKEGEYGVNPPTEGLHLQCTGTDDVTLSATLPTNSDPHFTGSIISLDNTKQITVAYPAAMSLPFGLNITATPVSTGIAPVAATIVCTVIAPTPLIGEYDTSSWAWKVTYTLPSTA
eukprot:CFRG2670T1